MMQQIEHIQEPDMGATKLAQKRWDRIAKPLSGLGLLEEGIIKIAGMIGTDQIVLDKKAVVIMCADNGVVKEQVSQAESFVTGVVARNFTYGNASVCIMAEQAKADVIPVDIGIETDLKDLGSRYPLRFHKISYGTRNMAKEPALLHQEVLDAIEVGIKLVEELKESGYQILATGEMGIGNTTTSSATASVLLSQPVSVVTGKGAGLSVEGIRHKINVIEEAIALHKPDSKDPIDILSKVGGLDLAGLTGIFLGGGIFRIPIVIDGFISGVAALLAVRLQENCRGYMLASHISKEPASRLILDELMLKPMLTCEMCLGEGTGAVAAFPLLNMAVHVYEKMSTFSEIKVEQYHSFR